MSNEDEFDYYEEFGESEEYAQWKRSDSRIADAYEEIGEYVNNSSKVFYLRELQVHYEADYFHWVTQHAVNQLIEDGVINLRNEKVNGNKINFIFSRNQRYIERKIKRKVSLIERFSDPIVTRAYGRRAEELFKMAFFGKQIYPPGYKELVEEINKEFLFNAQVLEKIEEGRISKWLVNGHKLMGGKV